MFFICVVHNIFKAFLSVCLCFFLSFLSPPGLDYLQGFTCEAEEKGYVDCALL